MLRFTIALFLLGPFLSEKLSAQINTARTAEPPALQCVRNLEENEVQLQWAAPVNPGSCFLQYGIYMSVGDRNGPYTKVDSVQSPGDGLLDFDPSTSGTVYFFMVNEQDCNNPNPPANFTSDTLDNIVPQPAITIINLTVENDRAVLNWIPECNPEIAGYVIYSNINNFNVPIDTVLGRDISTYIDETSRPSQEIAVYRMRSLEFCESDTGLLGNITPTFNSIRVTAGPEEPCARAVVLEWNGYNNQGDGVIGYAIESSTDGGVNFVEREVVASTARSYEFDDLPVGETTCIRIRAVLPRGTESLSNLVCVEGRGIAPVETHYIQSLTVGPESVIVEYIPDNNAAEGELVLERSTTGLNFNVLTTGVSIQRPSAVGPFVIEDFSALTNRTPYFYRVALRNICNDTYRTLPAKTILLTGINRGLDNVLEWTEFLVDSAALIQYELFRITDGDTLQIFNSATQQEFRDEGVYGDRVFKETCYLIRATHEFTAENRIEGTFIGESNVVCLQPRPQGLVPNAFAPEGTNRILRPILSFASDENYLFEVFNRFGEKVFSSNIPQEGWDGIYKGSPAALDSYVYTLRFTGLDEVEYQRTGTVLLVR